MKDVNIRLPIFKKDNDSSGLYFVEFIKGLYIAYIENIDIAKSINEPIVDNADLEKFGIYLLENIRKSLNFSEEKTKKIIKYIYDEKIITSKSFKTFILLLETYTIYIQVFLSAAVKNPTLIDFFESKDANKKNKTKIEIMKNLFNYLVGVKMLKSKLEISKLENILDNLFEIIDKYRNIFNKDVIDPILLLLLFKDIVEELDKINYNNDIDKKYIEKLINILQTNINYMALLASNTQTLGNGGEASPS